MCNMPKSIPSRIKDLEDHIIKVWKNCCIAYGGEEVKTPSLMDFSMANMYGNKVGDMVWTKDGFLRYDQTVSLLGDRASKNVKWGKFMQCGKSYRRKNGKIVIILQLDFDIYGDRVPMHPETECISLISEVSRNLNLEHVRFRVNHCGLLMSIFKVCGLLDEATQRKAWKILAEHGNCLEESNNPIESQLGGKLVRAGIDRRSVAKLVEYLELKGDFNFPNELEKDKDLVEDAKEIIEQLRDFLKYCADFHVKVYFDLNFIREFDYYTGLMLECICDDDGISRVIACGGRYDKLACRVKEGFDVKCMGFTFCTEALRDLYIPSPVQETSSGNPQIMVCLPLPHYSFWYGDETEMLCPPHGQLVWHGDTTEEVPLPFLDNHVEELECYVCDQHPQLEPYSEINTHGSQQIVVLQYRPLPSDLLKEEVVIH